MQRDHKKSRIWAGLFVIMTALPAAVLAQGTAEDRPRLIDLPELLPPERFRLCMTQAETAPMAALIEAEQWEIEGGGNLARECAATALANSGEHGVAAGRFEALARELAEVDPDYAAGLYREAARLWLSADAPQRAVWVLEAAAAIVAPDPQLLIQRARARGATGDQWGALDDLYQASALAPERPDLLALQADVLLRLNLTDLAIHDLTRAIELGGDFAELTVERGLVRARQGDGEGARIDFQAVLDRAPDSISADIARREIDRLENPS